MIFKYENYITKPQKIIRYYFIYLGYKFNKGVWKEHIYIIADKSTDNLDWSGKDFMRAEFPWERVEVISEDELVLELLE